MPETTLEGETKIEGDRKEYWNSKTSGYAKEGDQIKGVLLRMEAGEYQKKSTTNYVLGVDEREVVLPNHATLNSALLKVPIGKTVRIVYQGKGEGKRGRNAPELYDVYMSDTPTPFTKEPTKASPEMMEYMQKILEELKFGSKYFVDGIIPEGNVLETCRQQLAKVGMTEEGSSLRALKALKDAGHLFWIENTQAKGYKVT